MATAAAIQPTTIHEAMAAAPMTQADIPTLKRIEDNRVQLYVWEDFLPVHLCEHIINLAKPHLKPSEIVGTSVSDPEFRTSSTCYLGGTKDPFVDQVDGLIAAALGFPPEFAEPFQVQKYNVGQQYKVHSDYFRPNGDAHEVGSIRQFGQRTWTFMVYLNDVSGGGTTDFPRLDLKIKPKTGRAVIWNNLYPDGTPNRHTLHCGTPVEAGDKVIITKWFRDRPRNVSSA
ncbi:MAG: 2OG-Fe(II) oxygenase [Pseudomonadota bacterium]